MFVSGITLWERRGGHVIKLKSSEKVTGPGAKSLECVVHGRGFLREGGRK